MSKNIDIECRSCGTHNPFSNFYCTKCGLVLIGRHETKEQINIRQKDIQSNLEKSGKQQFFDNEGKQMSDAAVNEYKRNVDKKLETNQMRSENNELKFELLRGLFLFFIVGVCIAVYPSVKGFFSNEWKETEKLICTTTGNITTCTKQEFD